MSRAALADSLGQLYARVPLGMRLGLEAMQEASAAFGHPERAFPVVHVAGTNGKGSVSAMVEAMARAAGMKTGLYTSPHLCRFAERIRLQGDPIDDASLTSLLADVLRRAPDLSFFETATLAAFEAFRAAKVDLAVIEVGIGGRLDATNIVPLPRAAGITRIALDHMDRLGPTLTDIAREKAGIAKPGLEIVLGPMTGPVRAAIDEVATAAGGKTVSIDDEGLRTELTAFVRGGSVPLRGAHQLENAKVAYLLGRRAGVSENDCVRGVAGTRWAGRLESLATPDGPVLLDAAHNPDGAEALVRYLATSGWAPARTALVFGALADKAWPSMLDAVGPYAGRRFYVRPQGRAAADPALLSARVPGEECATVATALARARSAVGSAGLVLVTGSIFLVGEARAELLQLERDPAVAL